MPTMGPIEHKQESTAVEYSGSQQLYVLPRLGRRDLAFIAKGIHEHEDLHSGSIDADDVSVVMLAGRHTDFGYVCHIDTRDGRSYLVRGTKQEVEEQLFGEEDA